MNVVMGIMYLSILIHASLAYFGQGLGSALFYLLRTLLLFAALDLLFYVLRSHKRNPWG